MASNNHNGSNGNGQWRRNTAAEIAGLGIAEVVSAVVSIGVFAMLDDVAPGMMKTASKAIGKACVEPFLDTIEWAMQKGCKIKECQPDFTKPRSERAEGYARFMIRSGISLVPAILTEYVVRTAAIHVLERDKKGSSLLQKLLNPTSHDRGVLLIDYGAKLGGILAVNTVFAKQADNGIEAVSTLLQKTLGWGEPRATRAAESLFIWHVGEGLGFVAAAAKIGHHHYTGKGKS